MPANPVVAGRHTHQPGDYGIRHVERDGAGIAFSWSPAARDIAAQRLQRRRDLATALRLFATLGVEPGLNGQGEVLAAGLPHDHARPNRQTAQQREVFAALSFIPYRDRVLAQTPDVLD